jgi:hypothetical protein
MAFCGSGDRKKAAKVSDERRQENRRLETGND